MVGMLIMRLTVGLKGGRGGLEGRFQLLPMPQQQPYDVEGVLVTLAVPSAVSSSSSAPLPSPPAAVVVVVEEETEEEEEQAESQS